LYILCVPAGPEIIAWRPRVAGLAEVFHAQFAEHAYPMHTHDAWTLLIIDDGAVRFRLDRHEHGALRSLVTLLPPHVPHDGRSASSQGFRKRVLYLDDSLLEPPLTGSAVDRPGFTDPLLRTRIDQLHQTLLQPNEELEAESRLALVADRLRLHLQRQAGAPPRRISRDLASDLRDLLDTSIRGGISLAEAATLLHAHPAHLVRTFTREYGIAPHQYLIGRRIDLARRMLLAGASPPDVATAAGFYDQAHLTRHFKRSVGISPARYARGRSIA
jgi:AraC-like DNA-binding protein